MPSGSCTVNPSIVLATNDLIDNAKLNEGFQPSVQVDAGAITSRELNASAVDSANFVGKTIVVDRSVDHLSPGIYQSSDFVPAVLTDIVLVIGSTTASSASANFTVGDNGRLIIAAGVVPGSTITYASPTIIGLSQAAVQQWIDGVITSTTNLASATAIFTPSDTGRTVVGDGILLGTTVTYVDANNVTLSQAATNATGVKFQVNGRSLSNVQATIPARGRGWMLQVDVNGVGRVEFWNGAFGGLIAIGQTSIASDGTITVGTSTSRLTIKPNGDAIWGSTTTGVGIYLTHTGTFFVGGLTLLTAISAFASNGDFTVLNTAQSTHHIDIGAVNRIVLAPILSPSGGAIANPTNLAVYDLTQDAYTYYRVTQSDLAINSNATATSATDAFTTAEVGKQIIAAGIPANTYIGICNSGTSIGLSSSKFSNVPVNATATTTGLAHAIVPNKSDPLYTVGTPIALTVTSTVTARAEKFGEYSPYTTALFTLDATTVPNPTANPVGGAYTGASLAVTIADSLAGSSLFYTNDGTSPTHDGSGIATGTAIKIAPANSTTPPTAVATVPLGTTVIKMLGYKSGVTNDSPIVSQTFVLTAGGGGTGGGGSGGGGGGLPPQRYEY